MAEVARLCLTGPESTGKSALAEKLARELGLPLVQEYARDYALRNPRELTYDDVEPIARGEVANLDAVTGPAILDTDLISTVVYSRHYYGRCPEWIVEEARRRRADLYLLMDTDLPWVDDAARGAGDDAREDLFDAFRAALDEFEVRWTIVSGTAAERLQKALEAAGGSFLGG
ncbi:MAG TPA: ATP-binding protein [Thermoanaerobaculia bacterium]|nr:ATP-binding protein [Thermoanaerobaculia bacterium]